MWVCGPILLGMFVRTCTCVCTLARVCVCVCVRALVPFVKVGVIKVQHTNHTLPLLLGLKASPDNLPNTQSRERIHAVYTPESCCHSDWQVLCVSVVYASAHVHLGIHACTHVCNTIETAY